MNAEELAELKRLLDHLEGDFVQTSKIHDDFGNWHGDMREEYDIETLRQAVIALLRLAVAHQEGAGE